MPTPKTKYKRITTAPPPDPAAPARPDIHIVSDGSVLAFVSEAEGVHTYRYRISATKAGKCVTLNAAQLERLQAVQATLKLNATKLQK